MCDRWDFRYRNVSTIRWIIESDDQVDLIPYRCVFPTTIDVWSEFGNLVECQAPMMPMIEWWRTIEMW